ncbi:MAG: methionine biosynthesis protein MetW [Actinobacteria bacterium]|nr:methionine biosynthesis protein MetW [Actinomycetota bacterium]
MTTADLLRADLRLVKDIIPAGSRVLDLGCGDGSLMVHLGKEKDCEVRGIEILPDRVATAIGRGLSVVQGDLDEGLGAFPDRSFDVVVLSQTLQVVRRPAFVLKEMLRVGRCGVLTFPNFGHWRIRAYLTLRGRMPVSKSIPYTWYDTPNIHHTTLKDFREFVAACGGVIVREIPLTVSAWSSDAKPRNILPNLFADTVLALVTSEDVDSPC